MAAPTGRSGPPAAGRYDSGARRRATRSGRKRGCYIYIPLEELLAAGIDPDGPPPDYRTWGDRRGSVIVRLYPVAAEPDPQPDVEVTLPDAP